MRLRALWLLAACSAPSVVTVVPGPSTPPIEEHPPLFAGPFLYDDVGPDGRFVIDTLCRTRTSRAPGSRWATRR